MTLRPLLLLRTSHSYARSLTRTCHQHTHTINATHAHTKHHTSYSTFSCTYMCKITNVRSSVPSQSPPSGRCFSSITTTDTSVEEFHDAMEHLLSHLQDRLECEQVEQHNLDINLADGVLTVRSGERGTWVLNKHSVTRQMWLSSPISGPRKYNYHRDVGQWLGERDTNDNLLHRLDHEWSKSFGVQLGIAQQ